MGLIRLVRLCSAAALLCTTAALPAGAQDQRPAQAQSKEQGRREGASDARTTPAPPQRRLPANSVTLHAIELPGARSLKFKATAGSVPILGDDGQLQAEIAYISYVLADGTEDAKRRPVTFAFNGGPGSASAWLHLGALGPWRVKIDGDAVAPSAPPALLVNQETWLAFTDLVFIDPAGTGYSRVEREWRAGRRASVDGTAQRGRFQLTTRRVVRDR